MNLAQHSLRVATLAALGELVKKEYEAARKEAEAAYRANGIKKLAIALPDEGPIGEITVKQPGPTVRMDDDLLLEWVQKHTPDEVEEYLDSSVLLDQEAIEWAREHRDDLLRKRVRAVWRTELVKMATGNGGFVIDTQTGDSTKVAEVTPNKPTGAFALSADKHGERAARLLAALRAGELAGITNLAIADAAPLAKDGEAA
jgi:hypothetical protein